MYFYSPKKGIDVCLSFLGETDPGGIWDQEYTQRARDTAGPYNSSSDLPNFESNALSVSERLWSRCIVSEL